MVHLESKIDKLIEGYRGTLVYSQEYGYKLRTMMIDLHTSDEQSSVISRLGEIELVEEAKSIAASLPLAAIDVYHFPVVDGTEIELTIRNQKSTQTVRYTIVTTGIEECSSILWLDVVASSEARCLSVQSALDRLGGRKP